MKVLRWSLMVIVSTMLPAAVSHSAESEAAAGANAAETHVFAAVEEIKWAPAPDMVPKGARVAVLEGDPAKDGAAYTVRLRLPDRYKIPPHWHPTDENVTVISERLASAWATNLSRRACTS